MATTKLGNTKQASRAINYAEKRAVEKSGLNCDVDYAKSSFKATRELYGKNDGIQAHTIIQSFKPGEVTSKQANEIGLLLAKRVAKNHQVTVYTHDDKAHIHNHIVINSVDINTGKKYQSNKQQRELIKEHNDEICRAFGLSVPEKSAPVRYKQAERAILEKGQSSWKDEIRQAVTLCKGRNSDFESFQQDLAQYGIETKKRGSTVSYLHPDVNKWVRAKKLGSDYELGGLENEFGRFNQSRESTNEWEGFERNTSKRRSERVKKAERIVETTNDRDRERPRQEKQADRQTYKKSRDWGNEMEL